MRVLFCALNSRVWRAYLSNWGEGLVGSANWGNVLSVIFLALCKLVMNGNANSHYLSVRNEGKQMLE